jgi:hypothetical protein
MEAHRAKNNNPNKLLPNLAKNDIIKAVSPWDKQDSELKERASDIEHQKV